ncbi:Similar to CDC123: Cell division cycle protein 123 homolog (Macaca fascicularis) [Cotesia congregata]|uniref:Similar to CDC123: Cell division cycle protein 123 homolog (Macaca fascicularis) n=1 Tax=Cotesia congregata TaxID=51543 RepID=A0A8J2MUP7_COTCN|nr:Similar to CDC123: Cell division cycle protein 123 homolog (Macaca fascicularis) [Cotesia congregata]
MLNNPVIECSISTWYSEFTKNSLETVVLQIPDNFLNYLEHDAFILPVEATDNKIRNIKWSDGSSGQDNLTEDSAQPTFPEFSKQIQDVIDDFGAVFVKSNWRTPSDAMWVAVTKSLKCTSLEEVYLLLKSSDRISRDISAVKELAKNDKEIPPCLVLKKWRDINPCTEFRCFVVNRELVGICQRDVTQYHQYIENEKYSIQTDIKSLFRERIKDRFQLDNYTFDVIRYKKDKVKIVDFGSLDESSIKGTLFTHQELISSIVDPPEFRFIGENMGIQPSTPNYFCMPQELNEYFTREGSNDIIEMIRRAVETQQIE